MLLTWICLFLYLLLPGNNPDDRIAASLLADAQSGQSQSFIIILQDQADLSVIKQIHGKEAKGQKAFSLLRSKAETTQSSLLRILAEEEAIAQSFYLVNAIRTYGDLQLMRRLADQPEVALLVPDDAVRVEPIVEELSFDLRGADDVTWGIARIEADSVWSLGYTGQGVVIGGQDTGYEWEHEALFRTYRGWNDGNVDHTYNWHDAIHELNPLNGDTTSNPQNNPCGLDASAPCDDHNHGTHTMGTMAGMDSTEQIGVAPGATWIGCRNMERGWGSPSTYIECFEWFLAPTDLDNDNPDPGKSPHVINNSWSCPGIEGCDPSNFALMQMAVDNLRTAGIVVVVSAGNSGSGCHSVSTPAAIFESSFTVGASMKNDTIAGFSSRGPVTVDGSMRIKPNVVAPGVGVRSCIPGGKFASWSGTSMAGPHVAGAVALLISARPDLAGEVEEIETLLESTARILLSPDTCGNIPGTMVPNHAYGWGRINVFEAVKKALESSATTPVDAIPSPKIWPNPFSDRLTIRWGEGQHGQAVVRILDLTGRPLMSWQAIAQPGFDAELVAGDLHPGFYILEVHIAGTVYAKQVIHY